MADFITEALKRFVVMQFIESTTMSNSQDFMKELNSSAMNTAETLKGINDMSIFGSRPQQPQQPNVFNQQNPFIQPQQPQANDDLIQFVNETRQSITDVKNDMNDLKAQIFEGLQNLYQGLNQLASNLNNNQSNNNPTKSPLSK